MRIKNLSQKAIDKFGSEKQRRKVMKKLCSRNCQFYKSTYRPYSGSECLFNNKGWYKKTKNGKYCKDFKERFSVMFKLKTKAEIYEKYISLLKKEDKTPEDRAQIEILEWIIGGKAK